MDRIDVYDMLLETLGFLSKLGISEDDLIQNEEAINQLAHEVGVDLSSETFDLFMEDDQEHDMIEAVLMIYNLSNQFNLDYDNDSSESLMYAIHYSGKAKLASGTYRKMHQMKEVLKENEFSSFIRRTESE